MNKRNFLIAFLFIATKTFAQQIPDSSFESWSSQILTNANSMPYSMHMVDGWTSTDSITQYYSGGSSAFPGNDAHDGTKSLHLKTADINVPISPGISIPVKGIPGIATNGIIDADFSSLTAYHVNFNGGSPDTSTARHLYGWYKFIPTGSDSVHIIVKKFGSVGGARQLIASGELVLSDSALNYKRFQVDLNYLDTVNSPDTTLIILQSGFLPATPTLNNPGAHLNTELIVDGLSFTSLVGIEDAQSNVKGLNLFPNPASSVLHVDLQLEHPMKLTASIMTVEGKTVMEAPYSDKLDVSGLPAGNYLFNLQDTTGILVASRRLTVAR